MTVGCVRMIREERRKGTYGVGCVDDVVVGKVCPTSHQSLSHSIGIRMTHRR